jgi:hypothetical protein
LESNKNKSLDRQKRATGNKVLAKAGLMEVYEHLYFYQLLCYIRTDVFQSHAFANNPNRLTKCEASPRILLNGCRVTPAVVQRCFGCASHFAQLRVCEIAKKISLLRKDFFCNFANLTTVSSKHSATPKNRQYDNRI